MRSLSQIAGALALAWASACADERAPPRAASQRDRGDASIPTRRGQHPDASPPLPVKPQPNASMPAEDSVWPDPAAEADGGETQPPLGAASAPGLTLQYTEHLGQLTGEPPNALRPLGMTGTDLGVSFERSDRLYFVFGDSWVTDQRDLNRDSLAWTTKQSWNGSLPRLSWLTEPDGKFLPLLVDGIDLGGMNVPLEGVSVGERSYLFFSAGWAGGAQNHSTSVLAHADGDNFAALKLDHAVASEKFLNVSVVRQGDTLWIWGSGVYRRSPVYLARAAVDSVSDRASWRYFRGGTELGPDEASAQPVVADNCVGELSVRKHPTLGYLMAYNCGSEPRGIWLRASQSPLGPWSEPVLIYEPALGYEHFMHARQSAAGYDDGLSERGREEEWGGEYGPYLIPSWSTEPSPGVHAIVFTLSSWNPYQVHLMRAVLAQPGASAERPTPGDGLPRATLQNPGFEDGTLHGWNAEGDAFRTFRDDADGGSWAVTTHTDAEDATRGNLWQELTIDAQTSSLSFKLHGGHAAVALYADDVMLRRSRGRDDNQARTPVRWNLTSLHGKRVRLVIEDDLDEPWGFVSVSGFELR